MVENVFYFDDVFSYNPQLFFRIVEAFCLDVFYLVHGILLLFSPLEFLI